MIRTALAYAAHGRPVFALLGKEPPKGTNGVYAATTDPDAIRRMFSRPGLNVGIALPDHLVVDVDYKPEGLRWLAEHSRYLHGLTLTCRTGGGGFHFHFLKPAGDLRGLICKGVDLRRGAGHYVVAPPSIHPTTGAQYEWIREWPRCPQPVPEWLLEQIRREECEPVARTEPRDVEYTVLLDRARKYLEKCPVAVSGSGGHQTTITVAIKLVGNFGELDDSDLFTLLDDWNRNCDPPWSPKELRHKLNDALRISRRRAA